MQPEARRELSFRNFVTSGTRIDGRPEGVRDTYLLISFPRESSVFETRGVYLGRSTGVEFGEEYQLVKYVG